MVVIAPRCGGACGESEERRSYDLQAAPRPPGTESCIHDRYPFLVGVLPAGIPSVKLLWSRAGIVSTKRGAVARGSNCPFQQRWSGRLDGNTQPFRGLAHALIKAQQSEADDRGTRNEQRCEVDGIEYPNRVTGKRLTRAIDYLARDSQDLPMSGSRDECSYL